MYSMVLMAALTTGVDVPDFGRRGWGCCGCWGGWGGCYGGCYGWGGWGGYSGWGYAYAPTVSSYAAPAVMVSNTLPATTTVATRSMYSNPEVSAGNRAVITVHLPADAKLTVDGKQTRSTSTTRRFVSPPLQAGKSYHYVFKAKAQRDGKPAEVEKEVHVRAGQQRVITLDLPQSDQSAKHRQPPAERKENPERRAHAG